MKEKDKELAKILLEKFAKTDLCSEKNYCMSLLFKLYHKDVIKFAKSRVQYLDRLEYKDIEQEANLTFLETLFSYNPQKHHSFDKLLYGNIWGHVTELLHAQSLVHVPEQYFPAVKELKYGKDIDEIARERNLNKYHLIAAWMILRNEFANIDDTDENEIITYKEPDNENGAEDFFEQYSYVLTRDEQKLIQNLIDENGKLRTIKQLSVIMDMSEKKVAAIRNNCFDKIKKTK